MKIDLNADLREVYGRLAGKFQAPVAHQEERGIRIPDNAVRGCAGAPESEEPQH